MHRTTVMLHVLSGLRALRPVWRRVLAGGLVAGTLLTVTACGGFRQSPSPNAVEDPAPGPATSRNAPITQEELRGMIGVSNAYDAVSRARPLWLYSRGNRSRNLPTEIAVGMNGRYVGPAATMLRSFELQSIKELRYMDAAEATAFLGGIGARQVEAAIIIVLR